MIYENPPNKALVNFFLVMFIILFSIGLIFLVIEWGPYNGWVSFSILIGGGTCFIFTIWYGEYYLRPNIIEIMDDGLVLHMNYSRDIKLTWSDILGYFAYSEENEEVKTKPGSGVIFTRNGPDYTTNYRIVVIIASEYYRATGKFLPEALQNEGVRKFKKRVMRGNIN